MADNFFKEVDCEIFAFFFKAAFLCTVFIVSLIGFSIGKVSVNRFVWEVKEFLCHFLWESIAKLYMFFRYSSPYTIYRFCDGSVKQFLIPFVGEVEDGRYFFMEDSEILPLFRGFYSVQFIHCFTCWFSIKKKVLVQY